MKKIYAEFCELLPVIHCINTSLSMIRDEICDESFGRLDGGSYYVMSEYSGKRGYILQ